MKKDCEVRFWNAMNENIMVCGKYSHFFYTEDEALCWATDILPWAYALGAREMDINCEVYPIIAD